MTQPTLFQMFLIELLTGLCVAILATWLIPNYLERRKIRMSKLFLCFMDRQSTYQLHKSIDGNYEGTLRLQIKNSSLFSLNQVYLNIYIPENFEMSFENISPSYAEIDGRSFSGQGHLISGYMLKPINPKRFLRFPAEIKIKAKNSDFSDTSQIPIYYYFSTEVGVFPKSAEFTNDERASVKISDMKHFAKLMIKKPE